MEKLLHQKDSIICYTEEGIEGRIPLVFIHGFPLTKESWDNQAAYFRQNYKVVRYDISGLGKSVNEGFLTIDSHVEDLLHVIESCNIVKAVIIGLSMGGYIALRAFEKYPHLFLGLVLCNTKHTPDENADKIRRADQIASLKLQGAELFASNITKAIFSDNFRNENENVYNETIQLIQKQPIKGLMGNLLAMAARTDATGKLHKINIPTVIIESGWDKIISPEIIDEMRKQIKNSKLINIPEAGHISNLEKPELFNEALQNFLNYSVNFFKES